MPGIKFDDPADEGIDFSDLREQYEVRLEEGLDTFVVVDEIPKVTEAQKAKLLKFLLKKFGAAGRTSEDRIYMPINESTGESEGFAFVEFDTAEQASRAVKELNGMALDKKHIMSVNRLTDIERYGREGKVDENFEPPVESEFVPREHMREWLGDHQGRDQFALYRDDKVGVFWNAKTEPPELIVERPVWTESFIQWSPLGTYLTSFHTQGVQLWGGRSWQRLGRFAHPFVNLVDFSPNEKYVVTWSNRQIEYNEMAPGPITSDEDGKNFIIWDVETGELLRSFANVDGPSDESGMKRKINWPLFKWSSDDKYVARVTPGQQISIYETPSMGLLGKKAFKVEGVVDFEWSPAKLEEGKNQEHTLCYWTPEMDNQTARVGLLNVPSKEVVRTRNMFNVADCKLHWQSLGQYLCVKVDRQSGKKGKITHTNLEFFRVQEKNIPVEVVELKESVINFAWEPKGHRFALITTAAATEATATTAKTSVSFYAPEKLKNGYGSFHLIRLVDKKNSNALYWAPGGRFLVVATVGGTQSYDLEFWDLDFEGEKKDTTEKELTANLQMMAVGEHYGVTDIEWDPSSRYVTTVASVWRHQMENGFEIWDFKGTSLRKSPMDKFKQFLWRPRPATMLSKDQQKLVRKNLKDMSKIFSEEDEYADLWRDKEQVEQRRRVLSEWLAWRSRVEADLREEREDRGLSADPLEDEADEGEAVIEEIVEEVIEETEVEV